MPPKKFMSLVSAARAKETVRAKKLKQENSNNGGSSSTMTSLSVHDAGQMSIKHLDTQLAKYDLFPKMSTTAIKQKYGPQFLKNIPAGYVLSHPLGRGKYGATFAICRDGFHCEALKVIELRDGTSELHEEVKMQKLFHKHKLAPAILGPPIFYHHNKKLFGLIRMERIDGILDDLLKQNLDDTALQQIFLGILNIILKLDKANFMHRDMHSGNISFTYRRNGFGQLSIQLSLIDFGFSSTKNSLPELELTQFMRTLSMKDKGETETTTKHNQAYLWPRLLAFYQANFDPKVRRYREIENIFDRLFDDSRH